MSKTNKSNHENKENQFIDIDLKLNEDLKSYSNPILCNFPINKPNLKDLNSNNLSERSLILFNKGKRVEDYLLAGEKNNIQYEGKVKDSNQANCK